MEDPIRLEASTLISPLASQVEAIWAEQLLGKRILVLITVRIIREVTTTGSTPVSSLLMMDKEGYLFCYGSRFYKQEAQAIKEKPIATLYLPGILHHMRDPQHGYGPPDENLEIQTNGARLLMDTLSSCFSVTSLNLTANSLSLENLRGILSSLSKNAGIIKEINLSCNGIDYYGAKKVAKFMLANRSSLQKIILNENAVGGKGAVKIAEAVRVCPNLTLLDLRDNKITPQGVEAIMDAVGSSYSITSLDISSNEVSTKVTAACAHMLSTNPLISYLVVGDMYFEDNVQLRSLLTLVGDSTALEHAELGHLCPNEEPDFFWKKKFFGLPVPETAFYKGSLASAVQNHVECNRVRNKFGIEIDRSSLTCEDLPLTGVGIYTYDGKDFGSAAPKPDLIRAIRIVGSYEKPVDWSSSPTPLKIFDVALTEAGKNWLNIMVVNRITLVSLSVPDNKLNDDDIVKLLGSFTPNHQVKLLDFHGNQITCQGAIAVAALMTSNHKSFTSIDLHGNKIDSDGAIAIANAALVCAELKSINLEDNEIEQPGLQAFMKVIETCPKLTTLMLQHEDSSKSSVDMHLFESLLQAVKRSTSLTKVSLPKTPTIGELKESWLVQLFGEGTSADWWQAVRKHLVANARRNRVPFREVKVEAPPSTPVPLSFIHNGEEVTLD